MALRRGTDEDWAGVLIVVLSVLLAIASGLV
jgi:hypothetical protein